MGGIQSGKRHDGGVREDRRRMDDGHRILFADRFTIPNSNPYQKPVSRPILNSKRKSHRQPNRRSNRHPHKLAQQCPESILFPVSNSERFTDEECRPEQQPNERPVVCPIRVSDDRKSDRTPHPTAVHRPVPVSDERTPQRTPDGERYRHALVEQRSGRDRHPIRRVAGSEPVGCVGDRSQRRPGVPREYRRLRLRPRAVDRQHRL